MQKINRVYKIGKNGRDYLLWRYGMGDTLEIVDIAVYSGRRKGVGRSMIDELEKDKTIYAFCRSTNIEAHKFYKKLGFKRRFLPKFYPDGDAYIFIHETSK